MENGGILSKILLVFYRIATTDASCIFFQNQANKQFMQEHGIGIHQARLLPGSGVNIKEHEFVSYPTEEHGILCLTVIRIMKNKGIEEFLQMVQTIKEKYSYITFGLAGIYEEETRRFYEPQIQSLEQKGILHYYGHVNNIHQLMAESHIIVHPSYHEGLSNVLLEAAACGRPVIATDVAGCRETLIPGVSGLTFMPKNVDSFVNAMENMLSYSERERASMGRQGRSHIEAVFDRNIVIQAYLEEIRKTI